MAYLLRFYELLPGWVVALALIAASGSWVINYHWQSRYERLPLKPPMSLGLSVGWLSLGLFYLWVGVTPGLPENVRAGGVRVLLLVLAVAEVAWNGGMVSRSIARTVRGWRGHRKTRE